MPSEKDVKYDKSTELFTITDDNGTTVSFPLALIRPIFAETILKEEEKVKQLAIIVHEIEKEQLSKMGNFIAKMIELDSDMQNAIKELEKATSTAGIKKWDSVLAGYVKRKNVLAEVRRAIGLLERKKKPLRVRMAKAGFDPVELTGENE